MRILITGGTGFIGKALIKKLTRRNHEVILLTRNVAKASKLFGKEFNVEFCSILDQVPSSSKIDYIINLAGARIADLPWTESRRKRLIDSRIETTRSVVNLIKRLKTPPKKLITASAIGWYGPSRPEERLSESMLNFSPSFSHDLCEAWEQQAKEAEQYGVEVNVTRFGIVLGPSGGMLSKFMPFFKFGFGLTIGKGDNYVSWIHIDDVVEAIFFLMQKADINEKIFNFTAPVPVTSKVFFKEIAAKLHRKVWIKIPKIFISSLLGDMGRELILSDVYAVPENLIANGYEFKYNNINSAIQACV